MNTLVVCVYERKSSIGIPLPHTYPADRSVLEDATSQTWIPFTLDLISLNHYSERSLRRLDCSRIMSFDFEKTLRVDLEQ